MNDASINFQPPSAEHQRGDIFITEGDNGGTPFILSIVGGKWVAIGLDDGQLWNNPTKNIELAVNGLRFVGRDLKIVISTKPL